MDPGRVSEKEAAERFGVQTVYYGNPAPCGQQRQGEEELALRLEYPSWRESFQQLFG